MPFDSDKQRKFMFWEHPKIAEKMAHKGCHAMMCSIAKHYAAAKASHMQTAEIEGNQARHRLGDDPAGSRGPEPSQLLRAKHASEGSIMDNPEVQKEHGEHPEFPIVPTIVQIVEDHLAKHGHKATMRKVALAYHASTARHTGLGAIPTDYKKKLEGEAHHSGPVHTHKARHGAPNMDEFAEVKVRFLKEGEWHANERIPQKLEYPWPVIEESLPTFKGTEFFIDHNEYNGTEMGLVQDTYPQEIDGEKWACANIRVPESKFTDAFLSRIENGLIQDVSSTHTFFLKRDNPSEVARIVGDSISTVRKGEIDGARILSIRRHMKSPRLQMKQVAHAYDKMKGVG